MKWRHDRNRIEARIESRGIARVITAQDEATRNLKFDPDVAHLKYFFSSLKAAITDRKNVVNRSFFSIHVFCVYILYCLVDCLPVFVIQSVSFSSQSSSFFNNVYMCVYICVCVCMYYLGKNKSPGHFVIL